MKFYIQWDSQYPTKAYQPRLTRKEAYTSINLAMLDLKAQSRPHRLCQREPDGSMKTLVFFEGQDVTVRGVNGFTDRKLKTLTQIGLGTYVPTRLVRKSNLRRKKKKCKKSGLLAKLKTSAKSTP